MYANAYKGVQITKHVDVYVMLKSVFYSLSLEWNHNAGNLNINNLELLLLIVYRHNICKIDLIHFTIQKIFAMHTI